MGRRGLGVVGTSFLIGHGGSCLAGTGFSDAAAPSRHVRFSHIFSLLQQTIQPLSTRLVPLERRALISTSSLACFW